MKSSVGIYLISLMLIFSSCKVTSSWVLGNYIASADENEVVYTALIAAINPDSIFRAEEKEYYRNYFEKKLNDTTVIKDSLQILAYLSAFERLIDTQLINLYIYPKLAKLNESHASTISDLYFNSINNLRIDSFYIPILQNLLLMDHSARFKLKPLPPEYGYVLMKKHMRQEADFNIINYGSISFSRVSFNPDHTKACLTIIRDFGPLNAHGRIYFLTKDQNSWHVEDTQILWYS